MSAIDRLVGLIRPLVPRHVRPPALCGRHLAALRRDGRISGGPFTGMRFITTSLGRSNGSKWIGTFELELRGIIERWRSVPFHTIVDVGAAEGYYATGCALAWPEARVVAFESKEEGRRLMGDLTALNELTSRVRIEGRCTPETLARALPPQGHVLLLMDVEGAEISLLDPLRSPSLRHAHILVKVHDCIDREIGGILQGRFHATHDLEEIWSRERGMGDFTWPDAWVARLYMLRTLRAVSNEWRPSPLRWFAMTPKGSVHLTADGVQDRAVDVLGPPHGKGAA